MKILCIGNSFSEDATNFLHPLLKSYDIDTLVVNLYIGGCSLEQHWYNIQHSKQDYLYMKNGMGISPGEPSGRIVSINEVILEEEWDIVTIQQSSLLSGLYESFFPEINFILEYIKKQVKKTCELYLHEPWSWESSYQHDPNLGQNFFSKYYKCDDKYMFDQIAKTYETISKIFQLPLIRSGNFIQFLREFDEFNFNKKESIALCRDRIHMHEIYGRYALSLLWADTLFSVDIAKCKYFPDSITELERANLNKLKEKFLVFKTNK
ncbi:MAG: DUF4886 domain-containing protein [Flavobacteriales bacterium]|jgi:hypothetical protein